MKQSFETQVYPSPSISQRMTLSRRSSRHSSSFTAGRKFVLAGKTVWIGEPSRHLSAEASIEIVLILHRNDARTQTHTKFVNATKFATGQLSWLRPKFGPKAEDGRLTDPPRPVKRVVRAFPGRDAVDTAIGRGDFG